MLGLRSANRQVAKKRTMDEGRISFIVGYFPEDCRANEKSSDQLGNDLSSELTELLVASAVKESELIVVQTQ